MNEHQLAPADIHELQQVQQPTSATGGGGDGGGNRPLHPPGASAIAAAAAATAAGNTTGASSQSVSAGRQNQHQRQQQRSRYSEPGTYSHGHGHGHSSHGGLYPPGGPVPGDGRVILGRRESAEPDRPGSSSKWGPEPLPLSPEASPLMMPASGGSGGSQPGPPGGRQPPHLGLDASSSAHSRSSHSHSHSNLSSSRGGGSSSAGGGGSRGLSLVASSYGKSHSHGYSLSSSYRGGSMLPGGGGGGPTGGMAASSTSLSTTGGFHVGDRKSSMKTHITSATEGEMTLSDGHQSSNFSDRSGTSMSLLSSPYRRDSGQQYDGPAAPASVGNVLGGSGGGIGAALGAASSTASAIPTAAAAAKGEELTSTAPSTAAMTHHDNIMALNSTNFASAARTAGYGKRRSSTAYQSSELDYSTSAAGGSMQFGTSPYLNSRRASALTELTASTIPSRRDSASPPEEEEGEQYHRYYRSSSGGGGDGSASMRSTKSSSASTVGSSTSRATTKSRKKERNALRRTNSQSDILKVMAGGGVGQTHLSLEEKSRRKSDAFLRKVHEMQVQQRQKLIAVQEAEELRMHHLEGDNPSQQPQLHQYPSATGRSDRSLSVSGSGTSGSVTVTHSNTALSVNTKGTESSDNAQVQILAGTMEAPPQIHRRTSASTKGDDASEDNSIQKFVSGILGMGASDEKGKQPQQQEQRSTSSAKQQPLPQQQQQQQQQIQQQIQQQKQLLHQVQLQQQQQQRGPTNTGQYLNEAAFVQHVERQRAAAMAMQQQQQKQSSSSVAGSSSGRSKKSSKGDSRRRSDDGLPLNTVSAIPSSARENQRALYPGQQPPLHPPQQQQGFGGQSTHQHPLGSGTTGRGGYVVTGPGVVQPIAPRSPSQHHGHGADSKSCAQCTILEKQLIALQADLDYLRSIITQNEFICADCEAPSSSKGSSKRRSSSAAVPSSGASVSSTKSKKSISTSASRKGKKSKFGSSAQLSQLSGDTDKPHESDALNDASQRLMAVASRHKRQIEQMTKETARWQNDMHLKLSKMSMMCKDLNDESAKRKEEATNIQATLARVRADRNALESEVESLRARIALYEKEDVENDRVSRALDDKETTDLDRMDTAIEDRDGALTNMSSQLDRALTSLEAERKEQMESHSARKKSMSFNPTSANETSFFNPLLGIARAARVDEGRAENDEVAETTRKEDELQKRCKALEKELEAAQERLRKSAANA